MASLLALFVRACSHQAIAWIPHRLIDGYGLSEASLAAVQEHRAQVMITFDCGIADHGFAKSIEQETGCAVIITDHLLPQGSLPECTAVCNPNRPQCAYPDKHLAGVGVAWKLSPFSRSLDERTFGVFFCSQKWTRRERCNGTGGEVAFSCEPAGSL